MKNKSETTTGLTEICRKLKLQLDELAVTIKQRDPNGENESGEDESRRLKLMEHLKRQLAELST